MNTRKAILALGLLASSCMNRNQRSDLVITKTIPATATAGTTSVTCKFDPGSPSFTPGLPFNPAENQGVVAAVVSNSIIDPSTYNPTLRTNTATFLPHQVVLSYEFIPAGPAAPALNVVPTSGGEVKNGSVGAVGFTAFAGVNMAAVPAGTWVRITYHVEGKLNDGSLVRSSESEYLFQVCTTAGCGTGGPWAAVPSAGGTTAVSCL